MWKEWRIIPVVALLGVLPYLSAGTSIVEPETACVNKGETYAASALAPVCRPTCTEPDKPLYCKAPLGPGCECPDGQVLDTQKAQCVPEKECTDVCSLEPEVGTCKGNIPRLFYNSTSNQCEKFFYGGCGGNGNNFNTLDECLQQCRSGECTVEGQVFSTCARPCTFTCDNVEELACIALCTTGCDCPGGEVIDTELNKCVPVKDCPNLNGSCLAGSGNVIPNGETTGDACSSCTCTDGNLACYIIDCAFPDCTNYYTPEGACCPVCAPYEVEACVYNGELHSPGDTFVAEDDCNTCSCMEGGRYLCTNTRRCRKLRKRSCPENPFGIGHCAIQCLHDSECRGLQKCCNTACGGTQCIRGKRRKPPQKPDCAAVLCPRVDCPNATIPKGECCAVCPEEPTLPPKCAAVLCLAVDCPGAMIPEGECCPVCPGPTLPPKCAAVLCLAVDCPGAMIPEGECCPVCPTPTLPPKCAAVLCLAVECPGAIIPEGECCPVCPNVCDYNGQTYNPGDSFPSSDGCNTCFCSASGNVACTEKACIQKLVCPKPTGFGICVESCAAGLVCGPGVKCCSNGCGHVCTNATDCALVDCEPPSCNFIGGVVVPAGEDECCPTCGCMWGNNTYRVGESFPAGDGCNGCSCRLDGVVCTLVVCDHSLNYSEAD